MSLLAHNVFFTLKDDSPEAQDHLVAACHQYLKDHLGVVFFAAGKLVPDLAREVNDQDFQVALHVIFQDRASHDAYQVAETHNRFIEETKANWKQVRVFDSNVTS